MLNIPEESRVAYVASLLRGNAAMWWRERCELGEHPVDWPTFCAMPARTVPRRESCPATDEMNWRAYNSTQEKMSRIFCSGLGESASKLLTWGKQKSWTVSVVLGCPVCDCR